MIMGTIMDKDIMMQHRDITLVMVIFTKEMPMPTILDMGTMVFMGNFIFFKNTSQISLLVTIIHVPIIIGDFMDTGSSKQDMCTVDIPTIGTITETICTIKGL